MTTKEALTTFLCEETRSGQWRFKCPHCRAWHYHGPMAGHRVAHCWKDNSPYTGVGYNIELRPDE